MYYITKQNGNRTCWPRSKNTVNTKLIKACLLTAIVIVATIFVFSFSIIPPFPTTNQRIANAQTTPARTSPATTAPTAPLASSASSTK